MESSGSGAHGAAAFGARLCRHVRRAWPQVGFSQGLGSGTLTGGLDAAFEARVCPYSRSARPQMHTFINEESTLCGPL